MPRSPVAMTLRICCVSRKKVAAIGLLPLALSACAPNLNWRDVSPEQADGLKALFPCKPDAQARQVPWPGARGDVQGGVLMHLLSCQADGRTWSLSYMTLNDATLLGPALSQWSELTRRNLIAAARMASSVDPVASHDLGPVQVPHMTPMPQAHAWHFQGLRPDGLGRPMAMDVWAWHFSHGMTVFQASVAGPADQAERQSSEDVAQAFFRGFHFPG
ncbi:MAG: hypothetical protein QM749_03150 [Aquabacterium sp.]